MKQEMNTLYLNKEGNMENSNTIKRASTLGVILENAAAFSDLSVGLTMLFS
jgi:hypothetical protein